MLDAISDHEGKCTIAGSVDEDQIIKSIIEIMEGGKPSEIAESGTVNESENQA